MRGAVHHDHQRAAERLALRAGVVPTAAAEAWGGMALSAVMIAAVRTGLTARLARRAGTAAELSADAGLEAAYLGAA